MFSSSFINQGFKQIKIKSPSVKKLTLCHSYFDILLRQSMINYHLQEHDEMNIFSACLSGNTKWLFKYIPHRVIPHWHQSWDVCEFLPLSAFSQTFSQPQVTLDFGQYKSFPFACLLGSSAVTKPRVLSDLLQSLHGLIWGRFLPLFWLYFY